MAIQSIKNINVSGKRVLLRTDFNVEFDEAGVLRDAFRIEAVQPTIEYLMRQGAKVVLLCHLDDPIKWNPAFSTKRLVPFLTAILKVKVKFVFDALSEEGMKTISALASGEVALLENLRFHPEEKLNDPKFAEALARRGDIYINDAFSVSHRNHASIVGITKFLPSYPGFLFEQEIEGLSRVLEFKTKPLTVILGGAKSSSKLLLLKTFLARADNILLGGILANAILQAQGIAVGRSRVDDEVMQEVKDLLLTDVRLHLPVDLKVARADLLLETGPIETRICAVGKVKDEEYIYDIGPETGTLFANIIAGSKEIIWNGPMGVIEKKEFMSGTERVARAVADSHVYSVVGGGESVMALHKLGLVGTISHISTAGGAMLQFLSREPLPGLEALKTQ